MDIRAILMGLAFAVMWSSAFTSARIIVMDASPLLALSLRYLISGLIGVGIALQMGASPDPFLMAVAVGASCAFLTPIGHQCNALILGPGGYRFGDYWRMGLPLEVLIVAGSVPLILYRFPLFPVT